MRTIARYLLRLLVAAATGALLGGLFGGLLFGGFGVGSSAIIWACIFASLSVLYDPRGAVIHSDPNSRGETFPYNRDD